MFLKSFSSISFGAALLCVCTLGHAQMSMSAAQAEGLSLGSSQSQTKNAQALSNQATQQGSSNVMGSQYTGDAPQSMKDKATSPSLFMVGNDARLSSTTQVSGQNDPSRYDPKRPEEVKYSTNRDNQSNEAVYFLDKHPQVKPTFDPNDPLVQSSSYALNQPTFPSSSSKECKQVTTAQPATVETLSCLLTYSPYIYTCTTENTVSFQRVPGCATGAFLGYTIKYICACTDPYLIAPVYCANNGAGYTVSAYTSRTSSPGSPYATLFGSTYVPGAIGTSMGPTFIRDAGNGCSLPMYMSQSCDSVNCFVTIRDIGGGGCGGSGKVNATGTYAIPMVDKMTEGTLNNCGSAEQLSK